MNTHQRLAGFGIAGNSAGHLDQTGEIVALDVSDQSDKPRALFPFYVPDASDDYLTVDPYSSYTLQLPDDEDAIVQMEPELAIRFSVQKPLNGHAIQLIPRAMTVANDATHRNCKANKLAQKKNWGKASKGLANVEVALEQFDSGLGHFRLCGFHYRNGTWQLTGKDTALTDYTVFYDELTQWINKQAATQSDEGALHNIQGLLKASDDSSDVYIMVGAVRYTEYGETHRLQAGDKTAVILYDSRKHSACEIQNELELSGECAGEGVIGLVQGVIGCDQQL
ncbi:DUF5718 family protein [Vibrio breoganii]|uniref:DUF5718 family protein n=1 Tax=Vibrio breoganii TaxID=553239 RepID=UPI0003051A6B|nr:DUF5718 family protein [Vibrio breoganii]OEF82096.1 hypothetical protein B003_11395 [Vibrio breoganii 1C10]PMI16278.1 hypothetical protein BCU49_14640 [Vibrio breoganii]PML20166.1 hypothetical protein BCT82_03890 [Vibrio breoganii]PML95347.1 hypothetical protein BCT64_09965 [Vibrio breoganii]PMN66207.1 hypothetical protein BCT28_05800 [Vibrio breoganii]